MYRGTDVQTFCGFRTRVFCVMLRWIPLYSALLCTHFTLSALHLLPNSSSSTTTTTTTLPDCFYQLSHIYYWFAVRCQYSPGTGLTNLFSTNRIMHYQHQQKHHHWQACCFGKVCQVGMLWILVYCCCMNMIASSCMCQSPQRDNWIRQFY